MAKVHRTSVIVIGNEITGSCTCGQSKTVYAYNKKGDHLVEYRAYRVMRQLMDRHWWRKHGKVKLFGPNWKKISSAVPPSTKRRGTFDDYLSTKERVKPVFNAFNYVTWSD